jgi:hypothetical protein
MGNKKTIQRVELDTYTSPVFCPACGHKVIDPDSDESPFEACSHTLFFATDEGFEFRSERFDTVKKIVGVEDDDLKLGKNGYDGFTDNLPIPNSVKFAIYVPAPGFMGMYVGFEIG